MPRDDIGLILPPGVDYARDTAAAEERLSGHGIVVNETDLPDGQVQTFVEEHASVLGINQGSTFSTYANEGSLLARSKFRTPANVIDEIILARDMAERDDDVAAAMGAMMSVAFGEGMANSAKDEVTAAVFDEIAKHANLDELWYELYREWLIAGQMNTASLFTRSDFQFQPDGADRARTRSIVAPLVGILPAEQIRIVGSDMFRTGVVAYKPATGAQEKWLEELFNPRTTEARRAEMRREDPVLAALCVEQLDTNDPFPTSYVPDALTDQAFGQKLYRLNPRMVHRTTMAKGAWAYPRPPLMKNFALLEAKRLLNLMDYSLLQGGSNFLVVAKKGSDQRPALPEEVRNLREVVRRASRTGVIIGDHRLDIEIITPDLSELLSPDKRKLVGRKLANALLRVPEADEDAGGEGMKARVELISRVLTADRRLIKRHVERYIYEEAAKRNTTIDRTPTIWFPKIILAGTQYFTDYVLKARDRGDISRHTAVEVAGFDYDAEVRKRKLEKPDDRTMTPAVVPFSSPNAGPQDNSQGRPRGSSSNNGAGPQSTAPANARPRKVVTRNAGETVTARYEEDVGAYRIGELTFAILEEYADTKEIGRITTFERAAVARIAEGEEDPMTEGPLTVIPVNTSEELGEVRAVRLQGGVAMLLGERDDGALLARAYCFREPAYTALAAQETALRWGYEVGPTVAEEHGDLPAPAPGLELHVHADGKVKKKVVNRDPETGAITSIEEVDADADE